MYVCRVVNRSKCKNWFVKIEYHFYVVMMSNGKKIVNFVWSSINLSSRIERSEFNLDLIREKTDLSALLIADGDVSRRQ